MSEVSPLRISAKSLSLPPLSVEDVTLVVGELAVEEEWEPLGPTPMPSVADLRAWDRLLLSRYEPFYMPFCDQCCLCTYGKCDLTAGRRGSCGLDQAAQQARLQVLACAIGAATHTAHAKHLLEYVLEKYGDVPVDLGRETAIEAPITRLVTGIRPRTVSDFRRVLSYIENEIIKTLASTHTGQESDCIDFESKALHLGMMDHLALEVADIAQIVALKFPKGVAERFVEIGLGVIDPSKPAVLCIGHNVAGGANVIDYMKAAGLGKPGEVLEVAGLCCTGHDISRYEEAAKIIGPISHQLRFVRLGFADVIMVDEQCVHTAIVNEAQRVRSPVIAVTDRAFHGLPDMTERSVEEIVSALASGAYPGAAILDEKKAGAVAVLTALQVALARKKRKVVPSEPEIASVASPCVKCGFCKRNCPIDLPTDEAVFAAKKGDISLLRALGKKCLGCARCESACPRDIPVLSLIVAATDVSMQKYKMRVGRGPITDVEIREVGRPIVMGEIPGVVALVGCANYPDGYEDVAIVAEEFARRRYIVTASGCAAMSIAMYKDEEGLTLYEKYSPVFEAGGLVNVGSCVANAHIAGAAIKIANIFARRPLRANYEEIADYILNRVGAVGVAWGAMSQKAAAIAMGFCRLGVPVILGPQGTKYRKLYLGRKEKREKYMVRDMRTGERVWVGPAPEHLLCVAETREELMVMIPKLCIRPSDTTLGRQIKLTHYVDLYKKTYGSLPKDLHMFIRSEADIPITFKQEIKEYLRKVGWEPHKLPSIDPYFSERAYERVKARLK